MSIPKLINLGLPKSGTTTLEVALRKAGWKASRHRLEADQVTAPEDAGRYVAEVLYDGYFLRGDPLLGFCNLDALCEVNALNAKLSLWPQSDFGVIAKIRDLYPDTKFTATWRPSRDISDSMLRWTNLGTVRLPRGQIPGLPAGYGDTSLQRVQWIDAHYAHLAHIFADDPQFFLCDVTDPDTPALLGEFLNLDLPWWGRANQNHDFPQAGAA